MIAAGRAVFAVIILTVVSAGVGGWLGVRYGLSHSRSAASLNHLLHDELHLDARQRRQLAAMETVYAAQRRTLEQRVRAANRELASALRTEHQYGPRTEQAIDQTSAAMKSLQVATIMHVMAMRTVLTPQQAKKYDETVTKALDSDDH